MKKGKWYAPFFVFININVKQIKTRKTMLYYNFNYQEFQYRFGFTEHDNGKKSRRNKVLLNFIKDRNLLKECIKKNDFTLLNITNMVEFKKTMFSKIQISGGFDMNLSYKVELINYTFHSNKYSTDEMKGLCEDSDYKSCSYINHKNNGRIFKMKAGKFIRNLILETEFGRKLPETTLIYLQETFCEDWQTYSMSTLHKNNLYVNDNFADIYNSSECKGDFNSCMMNRGFHTFYQDAVNASAAYLRNDEGKIVARCIIYNKVHEEGSDKIWRLAERQYSTNQDNLLKRALVEALIREGYIDGYKQVGFDCHNARGFVDVNGNSLESKDFWIDCDLETYEPLSYQDSFKWYDMAKRRAYNYQVPGYDYNLDTTEGSIDGEEDDRNYDEYHDEYTDSDTVTVMYHGQEMSCSENDLEDFIWIDSEEIYYHKDDLEMCPVCDDWFLENDGYKSDLTGETYCCADCRKRAEDEYREEHYPEEIELASAA